MEYHIFLRLIHIVSAVFWAGATMYLAGFVAPAVKALGPDGSKFMQQLAKTNKLPLIMTLSGTLSVVGGFLLMWEASNGFTSEGWLKSTNGMTLMTGGALALIAYILGFAVNLPTVQRMNAIGKSLAASGGPPSAAQQQEMQKLRNKLFAATNVIAILLLLTVISMSIARYLN